MPIEYSLSALDYLLVGTYGVLVIWIGLRLAGRHDDAEDYFLAGRSMRWPFVGVSLFASNISSTTLSLRSRSSPLPWAAAGASQLVQSSWPWSGRRISLIRNRSRWPACPSGKTTAGSRSPCSFSPAGWFGPSPEPMGHKILIVIGSGWKFDDYDYQNDYD